MIHLVDDLLDVSRLTTGKIRLRKERVELGMIIERRVATARDAIYASRHDLTLSLPRESSWLEGDPIRLEQVLTNLLTNPAKYTDFGRKFQLMAETEHGARFSRA